MNAENNWKGFTHDERWRMTWAKNHPAPVTIERNEPKYDLPKPDPKSLPLSEPENPSSDDEVEIDSRGSQRLVFVNPVPFMVLTEDRNYAGYCGVLLDPRLLIAIYLKRI